jgi:hypothetical protein
MNRTKNGFKSLPRVVGVVMDEYHPHKEWLAHIAQNIKPNTVIVTMSSRNTPYFGQQMDQRDDTYFRVFDYIEDDSSVFGKRVSQEAHAFIFLSYVKFHKGILMLFPNRYSKGVYGETFSKRIQDLIISAERLNVEYHLMESTQSEDEDNT